MNRFIVDASFSGAWLLPNERSPEAEELLIQALTEEVELAAPELWTYEMLNLLVVAVRRGRLDPSRMTEALDLLDRIPLTFYDHATPLTRSRMAGLASRFTLSVYDASYLELADRLQAPLRSLDNPLQAAAEELGLT